MVRPIPEILAYVDERVKLGCGDIVFTGMTCGVGLGDGRFLEPDDVVEAGIEGIGVLRNNVGHRPRRVRLLTMPCRGSRKVRLRGT
jgi:2-keto-4-pentenoate hydratase/2-oxohepta-3-ene-1,7-dioic acid hydratase in catechol pathway